MTHHLKTWPQFYQRIVDGTKTFEVRLNDQGFQCGDDVILEEYDPTVAIESHRRSGRVISFKIGYVFQLNSKWVVFSLVKRKKKNAP